MFVPLGVHLGSTLKGTYVVTLTSGTFRSMVSYLWWEIHLRGTQIYFLKMEHWGKKNRKYMYLLLFQNFIGP